MADGRGKGKMGGKAVGGKTGGREKEKELCAALFNAGAVKFGLFTLKSGMKSPVYIDLRVLVSYPKVLAKVAKALISITRERGLKFDRIAGVPYAALPIATAVSLQSGTPMIYPRKEPKGYGTMRGVEGEYKKGETVLLYDDIITTAESKIEAISALGSEGLKVRDVVVLVDREQGGKEELERNGCRLHSVLTVSELLEALRKSGKVSTEQCDSAKEYFRNPEKWQGGK